MVRRQLRDQRLLRRSLQAFADCEDAAGYDDHGSRGEGRQPQTGAEGEHLSKPALLQAHAR